MPEPVLPPGGLPEASSTGDEVRTLPRQHKTNGPMLRASLETDLKVFQEQEGLGNGSAPHPFSEQVSALTDSSYGQGGSNHSGFNNSKSNQDTIRSANKKQPPQKKTGLVSNLFDETQIVQNRSLETVNSASTGSIGQIKEHVGLTLPDLRQEHSSSPLTDTEKSVEPFNMDGAKPQFSFPSPPASPRPSLADHRATPCPPSPGGVNLAPRGSTFNLFPKSLIENSNVKVEHVDELPRLVRRNRAFHQSSNKVYVKHNQGTRIFKLLRFNWFHVFLRWQTKWSLLILMSVWTLAILLFALFYVFYDNRQPEKACGLGRENEPIYFAGAFAFSLETCTTVGYGLPNGTNAYFEPGCGGLQVIIYFQMAWSMVFNAFLLTFLYNRIGRSENRSTQVLYSDKALVSIVDGQIRFQIRLFDIDAQHPVVEAHVRLYCVMKHRPVPRPLRILQPNDELNGMLFLSFPSVVTHSIDMYSLLHPPQANILLKPKGLVLRQVDAAAGSRNDVICPICGESYGTFARWANHVRFTQIVEEHDEYPVEGTHQSLDVSELEAQSGITKPITDMNQLKDHFKRNVSEILCLVEGIDPMQSGTFQALQSYRYEDIVWEPHHQFSPCLTLENRYIPSAAVDKIFSVDLDRYHEIIPDPEAALVAANAAVEEAAANLEDAGMSRPLNPNGPARRKRHRRFKTLSNRTSDSLFAAPGAHDNNAKVVGMLTKGRIETV